MSQPKLVSIRIVARLRHDPSQAICLDVINPCPHTLGWWAAETMRDDGDITLIMGAPSQIERPKDAIWGMALDPVTHYLDDWHASSFADDLIGELKGETIEIREPRATP